MERLVKPEPTVKVVESPVVTFEVYQAKVIDTDEWEKGDHLEWVLRIRKSYHRYGNVGTTDRFDTNAAVYIVCASYRDEEGQRKEEWLSARFILGSSLSLAEAHELLQCRYKEKTVVEAFLERGHSKEEVAIVSRICGFISDVHSETLHTSQTPRKRMRLRFTAYAYALMIDQFLADYDRGNSLRFIIGLFRDELVRKSLVVKRGSRSIPTYCFFSELLPETERRHVTIDRGISGYDYPAYFLNTDELSAVLRTLIGESLLKSEDVAEHLEDPKKIKDLLEGRPIHYSQFSKMGPLLVRRGEICPLLSGEDLRFFLDKKVSDGPELRGIKVKLWKRQFKKILAKLDLRPR